MIRLIGQLVEFEKGITAQMNQVQVRELNGPGVSAFDEVDDGYAYEGPANDDVAATTETAAPSAASLDI